MHNILVNYEDATPTHRNFAYASAVTHGYHACDDVFWKLFMTLPISDDRWFDEDGIVRAIVTARFVDGQIEVPGGFDVWRFDGIKWVSH
jgi:hypothetical protein